MQCVVIDRARVFVGLFAVTVASILVGVAGFFWAADGSEPQHGSLPTPNGLAPNPRLSVESLRAQTPPYRVFLYSKEGSTRTIRVDVFVDAECPASQMLVNDVLTQALSRFEGNVELAFHHAPVINPVVSRAAAEVIECAGIVGGARAFEVALRHLHAPNKALDDLFSVLEAEGVSRPMLESCLKADQPDQAILSDVSTWLALGVKSTPVVLVNGVAFPGVGSVEGMLTRFSSVLSEGR